MVVHELFTDYVPYPVKKKRVQEVKDLIKSVVVSEKGGIPLDCLRETYEYLVGEPIPIDSIGYKSLYHLLKDIPEISPSRNEDNKPVLISSSSKTEHLANLIRKQKPALNRSRQNMGYKRKINFYDDNNNQIPKPAKIQKKVPLYNDSYLIDTSSKLQEKREVPNIKITNLQHTRIYEPLIKGKQLVGDDFFLQLCIRYLDFPFERKSSKSAIRCGTVASGQTLKSFLSTLKTLDNMSNKLLICLGTEDIYQRRTFEEMKDDVEHILHILHDKFGYSSKQITFCTLPPLANVILTDQRLRDFYNFNNFIRNNLKGKCEIIDLYNYFIIENTLSLDYDLFQENARMVSGTSNPYVLWNLKGRQLAMKIFTSTFHNSFN